MDIHQTQDVERFAEQALPFLQQQPAEHNLLLALLSRLQYQPLTQPPCLLTVQQDGAVVAVAIQTAYSPLLLSRMAHPSHCDALVHHIVRRWPSPRRRLRELLPQFAGPKAEAACFAQGLRQRTRLPYGPSLGLRIHQLSQVTPMAAAVPGQLRPAEGGDRPLLVDWCRAFEIETLGRVREDAGQWADRRLGQADLFVWERVGLGPVCMAGGSAFSSQAGCIGPVYTPPEHRRRGYGTATVAALSQQLLDQGCGICYLFTDVTNLTSNHIYPLIGYQPVCDWDEYALRGI